MGKACFQAGHFHPVVDDRLETSFRPAQDRRARRCIVSRWRPIGGKDSGPAGAKARNTFLLTPVL